jgi:hypothetical protein
MPRSTALLARADAVGMGLRRALSALLCLGTFAAVGLTGCPSGGVGDVCTPEEEYKEDFSGFKVTVENLESRSFQCQTRICIVNHFQGRSSCPQGQPKPTACQQDGDCAKLGEGIKCLDAGAILADCDPTPCGAEGHDPDNCIDSNGNNSICGGKKCTKGGFCLSCSNSTECPQDPKYECIIEKGEKTGLCRIRVCSPGTGDPQGDFDRLSGQGKKPDEARFCYVPGTKTPIAVPVCAQCSKRQDDAEVYCSCRCGPPSDNAPGSDDSFNFCECPEGFVCEELRPNVGLGDQNLTGKFCIRADTVWGPNEKKDENGACGSVIGHWEPGCSGTAPSGG